MKSFFILILTTLFSVSALAKMTYLYQVGNSRRVALANENGQLVRLISPEDEQAYHPEMSQDGKYVAYSLGVIEPGNVKMAIHVQNLETNVVEVWTPKANQYIHAEFSGDGKVLAFSGPVKKAGGKMIQNIQWIQLEKERKKQPVHTEEKGGLTYKYYSPEYNTIESDIPSYFPAVSSSGEFIVYHQTLDPSSKTTPKELVQYDLWTKKKKLVTKKNGHAMVPSLSADNRYLTYAGILNQAWDIHVIDLWTGKDRQITNSKTREFTPVFAPDGSIYYTHIHDQGEFSLDIYKIPSEQVFGKVPVEPKAFISESEVFEYVPSFSGDLSFSIQQKPALLEPPRSSFGAIYHEGKVYAAGGHQGPEHTYPRESFMDRLDIFDTETGEWTESTKMNWPRHGFQIVAHKGYIYAFGGFAFSADHTPGWQSLDIIERYDIAAKEWKILDVRLPRKRSSNVAAKVGNKVYLLGGWNSTPKHQDDVEGRFHREIDVFDLDTETVSVSEQTLPDPLRRAFTAVVVGDEILLLGGISEGASHFNWLDHVTAFNPKTNAWKEYPKLPFATFAPGAGVWNNRIYLFGGMNKQFEYLNTVFSYDLFGTQKWSNTGRYMQENKGFPQVVNYGDQGLGVLGGHTYEFLPNGRVKDTPVSTFELLTFAK